MLISSHEQDDIGQCTITEYNDCLREHYLDYKYIIASVDETEVSYPSLAHNRSSPIHLTNTFVDVKRLSVCHLQDKHLSVMV